ncbi:Winged helix DNA-binding domain-containing protein [Amycolatopsis marina]|uniref:Winged helix DNA-binding domain-containing protein n=1 Tax=Amycolatopsis marina TaxID=490629 RepID=A0A1I0X1G9_9PSEU|nr:winged helix DNA-binding domain-containing protein [Amycolatopsis marina]SFA94216.1 Winged helix DNA-binding domain-containing protein [Amycolatopsis marina]
MTETLSRRALNRALLARQLLLRRERRSAASVVEHLVGLQAQAPNPPYFALRARIDEFDPAELAGLLTDRGAVRATAMRGTIHLLTAADYRRFRELFQPMLTQAFTRSQWFSAVADLDLAEVVAEGRRILADAPLGNPALAEQLQRRWPEHDGKALVTAVQYLSPLVQVPPRGIWGSSGLPVHAAAEAWLGAPVAAEPEAEELVLRYLAAFGPASVLDVQAWCGLTRLGEAVERLRPRLLTFQDESGRELFDLPDAPRPDPRTPAPPRLLGEFDQILLGHADRARIISDEDRARVFTINGLVRGTFLVNGFVHGIWRTTIRRKVAGLELRPFRPVAARSVEILTSEAHRLLAFAAPRAESRQVNVAGPA